MEIGVTIHATDRTMSPAEVAREAEARGFYSLYIPEHTHIPVSRRTPPPTGTEELAEEYLRTPDPYIALAAAAAVTDRIRLGTGIGLPAQHDPITFAKELATLDVVSGGRLVFGIGFGWNHEEMENHGVEVKRRRALVREQMLTMQALWANEVAEFSGEFIHMEPSWQWPKPVQQPRPRILLGGGAGPKLFAHIAEYADGWMPIGGAGMKQSLGDLRTAMQSAGRDPASLHIVPMGVFPSQGKLGYYRDMGVTEVVLRLPSAPRDDVMPVLDEYAALLA
ncbi:MAG: LLM class F420-dependent oxidoreductase [Deltaproteobacteria bacterium]|jgi:probable F420-dependent oxidoreductase|nr:LLM class F420-dependent oxidoreductase [Deltaproteobacteria bacterium]MBW2383457.1 LLM class F420-dependent oxidoreductase [Deltaproteobacteria bacterium]MBW2696830.1 LLM class F420-dependent oxidoreductase [Deltaproteobacteria bacterium]